MTAQQPLLGVVRDQEPTVTAERKPTRQECIDAAGAIYGSILADPDRRAEILAHRAASEAS